MVEPSASLAALVGSRLCHDLISPIGAIQNGLELLSLSGGGTDQPEMALIRESCESATARIRFFRVAFGAAAETQMMSEREIGTTLAGISKGERLQGVWQVAGDLPRGQVQLAYLSHLCCATALPQGGAVTVLRDNEECWIIRGTGPKVAADPATWGQLAGETPDHVTPDRVQFALLADLAASRGRMLTSRADDTKVEIRIH